jgi:hypothetical protein
MPGDYLGELRLPTVHRTRHTGDPRDTAKLDAGSPSRSDGLLTAITVGLNDIEVSREDPNRLVYRVRYWTWAGYAAGLSGVILLALATAFALSAAFREQVWANPFGPAIFGGDLAMWGQRRAVTWLHSRSDLSQDERHLPVHRADSRTDHG